MVDLDMCGIEFEAQWQMIGWIITACGAALAIGAALFVLWMLVQVARNL